MTANLSPATSATSERCFIQQARLVSAYRQCRVHPASVSEAAVRENQTIDISCEWRGAPSVARQLQQEGTCCPSAPAFI